MPVKYTQATLDKITKALGEIGYLIRFEKGNFNSGYCILEHKKVVVVNKFLDIEGRINTLLDILAAMKIDTGTLSESTGKIYALAVAESEGRLPPAETDHRDEADNDKENKATP